MIIENSRLAINFKNMQLTWSIEGDKQLSRRLRGIQHGIRNWTPAFKQSAEKLKTFFQGEVFDSRGRAIGEPWKLLNPKYAEFKARRYPGKGILEATGKMRGSFKTLYKSNMAAVWNTAAYFKYHQSNRPRKKLPRRIMMKLGHEQRELVVKIFHTHFRKKIRARP